MANVKTQREIEKDKEQKIMETVAWRAGYYRANPHKNAFSALYERYIAKYTVKKPEYDEDVDSEVLFDKIFGKSIDEE